MQKRKEGLNYKMKVQNNNIVITYHKAGYNSHNDPVYHVWIAVDHEPFTERLSLCRRNTRQGYYVVSSYNIDHTIDHLFHEVRKKKNSKKLGLSC